MSAAKDFKARVQSAGLSVKKGDGGTEVIYAPDGRVLGALDPHFSEQTAKDLAAQIEAATEVRDSSRNTVLQPGLKV